MTIIRRHTGCYVFGLNYLGIFSSDLFALVLFTFGILVPLLPNLTLTVVAPVVGDNSCRRRTSALDSLMSFSLLG